MSSQLCLLSVLDLHDFPSESRSPQTVYEGVGTFLACQPPAHYPGKLQKKKRFWAFSKVKRLKLNVILSSFLLALSYRWLLNDFPNFVQPDKGRWFVSQVTGNLYLANARTNDTGNYFCLTTINMDITTKSTFSKAIQLTVQPDGKYYFSVSVMILHYTLTKMYFNHVKVKTQIL